MRTKPIAASSALLVGILGYTALYAQEPPAPQLVCGLEIYPSPIGFPEAEPQQATAAMANVSGDVCLDGDTVFGPERYERSTGKPVQAIADISLGEDADICIIATASDKGKAFLYLDGQKIAEPEAFDDSIEQQVYSLNAGSHGVGVTPVGKPGGYVDVEVRTLAGNGGGDPSIPTPGEVRIDPATGALDTVNADGSVRLQNVATDHPLLTPNGDGSNDSTVFQALTTPLVDLPGKDDGTVNYFVDWQFDIVDLATCNTINTGLTGNTQINSPTLVSLIWDGTDLNGDQLPDGDYAYLYSGRVVEESGQVFGEVASPGFGFSIRELFNLDVIELPEQLGFCDASADPDGCECPAQDPSCKFAYFTDLLPGLGLPEGASPNYLGAAPDLIDKSFITTTQDPATGRYTVAVDLRDYNAGGIVPKGRGQFADASALRQWVSDMTGVPVSTGDSVFNFDFVQVGVSTGVEPNGVALSPFNHFFLDAMTDTSGVIRVPPTFVDLNTTFGNDSAAPPQYVLSAPRVGDECTASGNSDGVNSLFGKTCAYNMSFPVASSGLGVHSLRVSVFDIAFNDETSTQEETAAVFGSIVKFGLRTQVVEADVLEIEANYYDNNGGAPSLTRTETVQASNAIGLSYSTDREATGEDGVCARTITTKDGLAVRMDAADGSVPATCVINGVF